MLLTLLLYHFLRKLRLKVAGDTTHYDADWVRLRLTIVTILYINPVKSINSAVIFHKLMIKYTSKRRTIEINRNIGQIIMGLEMYWIKKREIPVFAYADVVTGEMLDEMGKKGLTLAEQVRLYPIIDLTCVKSMPRNLMNTVLRSSALLDFVSHANTRMLIFVAPDTPTRLMIDTVFRNVPVKIVDTVAEAERILIEEIIPHDM